MYLTSSSSATLTGCTLMYNTAVSDVFHTRQSFTHERRPLRCIGTAHLIPAPNPIIYSRACASRISRAQDNRGGAVYLSRSSAMFSDCKFQQNTAAGWVSDACYTCQIFTHERRPLRRIGTAHLIPVPNPIIYSRV